MPTHNKFYRHPTTGDLNPAGLMVMGAFLQVAIHVPPAIANDLAAKNEPVPSPVSGVALIDTGATMTCVHESILKDQLGLHPISVITVGTASGRTQQNVYPARIVTTEQNITLDLDGVAGVDLTRPDSADLTAASGRDCASGTQLPKPLSFCFGMARAGFGRSLSNRFA